MRSIILLFLLVLCGHVQAEDTTSTIIETCWRQGAHAQMSKCVVEKAASAAAALLAEENRVRTLLHAKKDGFSHLAKAAQEFEANIKNYKSFKKTQCALHRILASTGNGEIDNFLACEAELDIYQASKLRALEEWM